MLRDDETEQQDRDAEAEFWLNYEGKTDCFGTVAKLLLLLAILVKTLLVTTT